MSTDRVIELKYEYDCWQDYYGSERLPGDAVLACVFTEYIVLEDA